MLSWSKLFVPAAAMVAVSAGAGCATRTVYVVDDRRDAPVVVEREPERVVVESSGGGGGGAVAYEEDVGIVDDSDFYEPLSGYGTWVAYPGYGRVWRPSVTVVGTHFRPYTHGHWEHTEWGWTWVDHHPFGWATGHYGRWLYDSSYGWVWVPGTVWSPAWVTWRTGGGYVGWAAMPPGSVYGGSYSVYETSWVFVSSGNLGVAYVGGVMVTGSAYRTCYASTYDSRTTYVVYGREYYRGPDYDDVRRQGRVIHRPLAETERERPVSRPPSGTVIARGRDRDRDPTTGGRGRDRDDDNNGRGGNGGNGGSGGTGRDRDDNNGRGGNGGNGGSGGSDNGGRGRDRDDAEQPRDDNDGNGNGRDRDGNNGSTGNGRDRDDNNGSTGNGGGRDGNGGKGRVDPYDAPTGRDRGIVVDPSYGNNGNGRDRDPVDGNNGGNGRDRDADNGSGRDNTGNGRDRDDVVTYPTKPTTGARPVEVPVRTDDRTTRGGGTTLVDPPKKTYVDDPDRFRDNTRVGQRPVAVPERAPVGRDRAPTSSDRGIDRTPSVDRTPSRVPSRTGMTVDRSPQRVVEEQPAASDGKKKKDTKKATPAPTTTKKRR